MNMGMYYAYIFICRLSLDECPGSDQDSDLIKVFPAAGKFL